MNRHPYILMTVVVALAQIAAASGQTIRLKSEARIGGKTVRLSQIAHVRGIPAAADVVVCTLGDLRSSARIGLEQIELALRQAGINPVPIGFSGAAQCHIRRDASLPAAPRYPIATPQRPTEPTGGTRAVAAAKALLPKTIGDQIMDQLAAQLQLPADQIGVAYTPSYEAIMAAKPAGTVRITSTDPHSLGRRRWKVEYTEGGRDYRRSVLATASRTRRVLTATRPLKRGEIVAAGDVQLADYGDTGAFKLMTDAAAVVGQQVRRAIGAGEPMRETSLIAPVLVTRGQTVWVNCGPVRLAAKALARGRMGERVQLENMQSKGRFWAIVTASGKATVAAAPEAPRREAGR